MSFAAKVWDPDDEDEPTEANVVGHFDYCHHSAQDYAKDIWHHSDYPNEMTIHVRDTNGELHRYLITVQQEPVFYVEEL